MALYALLGRMFRKLLPRLARVLMPSYDPRHVEDPAWVKEWWRLHRQGTEGLDALDTKQLGAPIPRPAQTGRAAA
jgi:hypothetical protein